MRIKLPNLPTSEELKRQIEQTPEPRSPEQNAVLEYLNADPPDPNIVIESKNIPLPCIKTDEGGRKTLAKYPNVGDVFKNYRELCRFFEIPIKGGNTKQSQLDNLQKFMTLKYDPQHYTYTVTSVNTEPILDYVSDVNEQLNNIYNIGTALLQLLRYGEMVVVDPYETCEPERQSVYISKTQLINKCLKFANEDFYHLGVDSYKLQHNKNIPYELVDLFDKKIKERMWYLIDRAIKKLQRNRLLFCHTTVCGVEYGDNGTKPSIITGLDLAQQKALLDVHQEALRELGYDSPEAVYAAGHGDEYKDFILGTFNNYCGTHFDTFIEDGLWIITTSSKYLDIALNKRYRTIVDAQIQLNNTLMQWTKKMSQDQWFANPSAEYEFDQIPGSSFACSAQGIYKRQYMLEQRNMKEQERQYYDEQKGIRPSMTLEENNNKVVVKNAPPLPPSTLIQLLQQYDFLKKEEFNIDEALKFVNSITKKQYQDFVMSRYAIQSKLRSRWLINKDLLQMAEENNFWEDVLHTGLSKQKKVLSYEEVQLAIEKLSEDYVQTFGAHNSFYTVEQDGGYILVSSTKWSFASESLIPCYKVKLPSGYWEQSVSYSCRMDTAVEFLQLIVQFGGVGNKKHVEDGNGTKSGLLEGGVKNATDVDQQVVYTNDPYTIGYIRDLLGEYCIDFIFGQFGVFLDKSVYDKVKKMKTKEQEEYLATHPQNNLCYAFWCDQCYQLDKEQHQYSTGVSIFEKVEEDCSKRKQ